MIKKIENKIFNITEKWGKKVNLDMSYFVKNGFWMALRQIVIIISGLIVSIFFTRIATKEIYGNYQFFVSIFSIVSILSIPGLNNSVARSVARGNDGDYLVAVKKSFIWSLIGVPILLIIGAYYFHINKSLGFSFMISSIFFPFFYAPNTWNAFFQGKKRYSKIAFYNSTQSIINAIATIAILLLHKDNLFLIIVVYLSSYTLFNVYYYYRSLEFVENSKTEKDTMDYGFFLTKMNFLEMMAENIDKLIVGIFLSPASLATFSVVSMIPIKIRLMIKSIMIIVYPKVASDKFNLLEFLTQKRIFLYFLSVIMVISGFIYYIFIDKVNYLFFGEQYMEYYKYSKYFFILIIICIPSIFLNWYSQAKKIKKAIFYTNPIYFVVKLIIIISFVYFWGLIGAIIAYNLNAVLLFAIYIFLYKKNQI
ncbi:MAG: hypothetical protein A2271_03150 [Candidatus Moranbacteria bacterium RIFOXYA12_FULL_35_19]|nr:MAG: hypothetical protein A2271_03150 [Candidatus Moranbacteria bacterium RIFOXYA12_FULL_35_19]